MFEYKLLKHSCFLLLNAYLIKRFEQIKYLTKNESEKIEQLLNYLKYIIDVFFQNSQVKPSVGKEEKFVLIFNTIIDLLISILTISRKSDNFVGELLLRISTLLIYYGEDTLSNEVNLIFHLMFIYLIVKIL